jgi:cephalosporin hydroxylase
LFFKLKIFDSTIKFNEDTKLQNTIDQAPVNIDIHDPDGNVVANLSEQTLIDLFHQLYYLRRNQTWENTYWFGRQILKSPLDLWIYQEIINEVRPDVIIETGTFKGASALYLANLCDLIGNGQIITIDIKIHKNRPSHHRIRYLEGSSISTSVKDQVKSMISDKKSVLVILDSDHSKSHVLKELEFYSKLVSTGSYLIVEDSNVNGHPIRPEWGDGPFEAAEDFLKGNSNFAIDLSREKFLMTFNPRGYLKKG